MFLFKMQEQIFINNQCVNNTQPGCSFNRQVGVLVISKKNAKFKISFFISYKKAQVAQLVERNFEAVQVISSNLILGIL